MHIAELKTGLRLCESIPPHGTIPALSFCGGLYTDYIKLWYTQYNLQPKGTHDFENSPYSYMSQLHCSLVCHSPGLNEEIPEVFGVFGQHRRVAQGPLEFQGLGFKVSSNQA